jgi:hypothetical protein
MAQGGWAWHEMPCADDVWYHSWHVGFIAMVGDHD